MNEQELLPCPFCGGEAIHRPEDSPSPGYWIRCTQCHAESDDRSSRETAAKTWNSRAATMPTTHPHSSPLEQVTDDWRLMPKEPTKQMVQAACDATFGPSPLTSEEAHRLGYAAMILVAPTPPAPQAEGEIERLRLRLDYEWGINDEYITRFSSDEQKLICAALRSAQAPTTPIEIEQLLKNAGLTSRDGTFVSAPTREIIAALRSAQAPATIGATKEQIKHMVDRFLSWRLPKPWNPDNGISYVRPNYAHAEADHDWPTGTNLFDATQADAMVRYMLEGLPSPARTYADGIEDAAKVAEKSSRPSDAVISQVCTHIAAAIRALATTPSGEKQ